MESHFDLLDRGCVSRRKNFSRKERRERKEMEGGNGESEANEVTLRRAIWSVAPWRRFLFWRLGANAGGMPANWVNGGCAVKQKSESFRSRTPIEFFARERGSGAAPRRPGTNVPGSPNDTLRTRA